MAWSRSSAASSGRAGRIMANMKRVLPIVMLFLQPFEDVEFFRRQGALSCLLVCPQQPVMRIGHCGVKLDGLAQLLDRIGELALIAIQASELKSRLRKSRVKLQGAFE